MTNSKKAVYFPLFVDLSDKKIVVIGAGKIACRRIKVLSQFTNQITVVGISIHKEVQKLSEEGKIILYEKAYEREDIKGADIAIIATNDLVLNEEIGKYCKDLKIMVNIASDKNKCDFHFPGIVKKEQLVIGVNAGGHDHKKAKAVRQGIEHFLDREEQS